jgi:hypothetical protein
VVGEILVLCCGAFEAAFGLVWFGLVWRGRVRLGLRSLMAGKMPDRNDYRLFLALGFLFEPGCSKGCGCGLQQKRTTNPLMFGLCLIRVQRVEWSGVEVRKGAAPSFLIQYEVLRAVLDGH